MLVKLAVAVHIECFCTHAKQIRMKEPKYVTECTSEETSNIGSNHYDLNLKQLKYETCSKTCAMFFMQNLLQKCTLLKCLALHIHNLTSVATIMIPLARFIKIQEHLLILIDV